MTLTHHPDCAFWIWGDFDLIDCDCGLSTGESRNGMRPWSQEALDEWRKAIGTWRALEKTP